MNRQDREKNQVKNIIPIPKFNENFLKECENIKLLMEKYLKLVEKEGDNYTFGNKNLMHAKDDSFSKIKFFSKEKCNNILKQIHKNMSLITSEKVNLKTNSRLVVGLGITSVLEVSMRLHHIYGIPYIPSPSVKGILRAYNILRAVGFDLGKYSQFEKEIDAIKIDRKEDLERLDQTKRNIIMLFGNQSFKGEFTVLDAYPTTCPNFEEDVINVHFNEYYQNYKPPTENMNPIPIKFLTLAKGAEFTFYFLNKALYKQLTAVDVEEDLKQATYYLGLGSKSSLGYGVLR